MFSQLSCAADALPFEDDVEDQYRTSDEFNHPSEVLFNHAISTSPTILQFEAYIATWPYGTSQLRCTSDEHQSGNLTTNYCHPWKSSVLTTDEDFVGYVDITQDEIRILESQGSELVMIRLFHAVGNVVGVELHSHDHFYGEAFLLVQEFKTGFRRISAGYFQVPRVRYDDSSNRLKSQLSDAMKEMKWNRTIVKLF
jgi:hypothetical protein